MDALPAGKTPTSPGHGMAHAGMDPRPDLGLLLIRFRGIAESSWSQLKRALLEELPDSWPHITPTTRLLCDLTGTLV